jgi:hypothetical protein
MVFAWGWRGVCVVGILWGSWLPVAVSPVFLRPVGEADDAGGAAGEEVRGGESSAVPVDSLELPG